MNNNKPVGNCCVEKYDRDRDYWNEYYKKGILNHLIPSDFAKYVGGLLSRESKILELGCGNGRDSYYFLRNNHYVTGVDASNIAIDLLNEIVGECAKGAFCCNDFVSSKELYENKYDCIYSRFTLHAITEEQENILLQNVKSALDAEGFFCLEARTIHDDIFGCGEKVGHNAYLYNGHFRRFIDVDEFKLKLESFGFKIVSIEENTGFSRTEESDPMLMRCIARLK